jgi:endoglucanase
MSPKRRRIVLLCSMLSILTALFASVVVADSTSREQRIRPIRERSVSAVTAQASLTNPLQGWVVYRYHNTPAAYEAAQLHAQGKYHAATLMEQIANEPIATWLTRYSLHVGQEVKQLTEAASRAGSAALIVTYDIPGQGCAAGSASRGAPTGSAYLRWIRQVANGIGTRRTIVILEPDALSFAADGCPIRLSHLRRAVELLAHAPGARVYIDAANPSWTHVKPLSAIIEALREAGIDKATGFSVNVSNFRTNAESTTYGLDISRALGGAHFVIDTSRNGNGPDTNPADAPLWCNPPGRALGTKPTTTTHVPWLDAYLWIKPPGASDEVCRPGEPPGGRWWQHYALELALNAET